MGSSEPTSVVRWRHHTEIGHGELRRLENVYLASYKESLNAYMSVLKAGQKDSVEKVDRDMNEFLKKMNKHCENALNNTIESDVITIDVNNKVTAMPQESAVFRESMVSPGKR